MSRTIIKSTTIDDRDRGNVTYAPEGWTVHTNVESIFHLWGNSDTFWDRQGATATVKFYGNAIEYWGNQGPYHGPCAISIDGEELTTVNSHADADGYPIMLYSNSDLELGDHTLEVKIVDASYPNVCEVDRFVANITSTSGSVSGSGGGGGGDGGSDSSGPPTAAIAGGVGGAAVLCILIVAFWLFRRSKRNKAKQSGGIIGAGAGASKLGKPAKPGKVGKQPKNAGVEPLLSDGLASPSPHGEKQGFNTPYPNQPVSYASSPPASSYNPPSSYNPGSPPPGAAAAFNPHTLSYTQGTQSPPPSSTVGTMPLPNSPNNIARPMSTVSSASGAPTMSYYTHGPESAGFAGYAPHPQQQQQQQQQAGPVWATPEPSTSPGPMHVQQPSVPSPSVTPAPTTAHYSPATPHIPMTPPPEKAQYMPRPEKAGFSGSNAGGSTAGGSTTGASGSGSGSAAPAAWGTQQDIMAAAVPDLPPPAYQ